MILINPIRSSRCRAAIAAAAVAVGALLSVAPAAPAHPTVKRCAPVPFTPASEDLAAEIIASGVSCAFARKFVRDSNGTPRRSYRGFTCARHRVESESTLPHTRYRCTRASETIRWKRF